MIKTISLIISIIINVVFLSVFVYYFNSNKVKLPNLYVNQINQYAEHFDRGKPIDRYYIESFLEKHKEYITGSILDMQSSAYAEKYGHDITNIDVLDYSESNPNATFTGDLQQPDQMPKDKFDCFILTQTLQYPYDTKEVLQSVYQMLKKDGVVIITAPLISRYSNEEEYEESWRFTKYSLKRLLEDANLEVIDIEAYGNTMADILFLEGIAVEDLKNPADLDICDEWNPMLIAAVAMKK